MKSKTSCFSGTLFWNTIRRFWPILAAYLLIWLIILPLSLNSALKWIALSGNGDLALTAEHTVLNSGTTAAPIMAALFGLFFAMAAYSYLYSSRSVSMICSLPIKREGVFISMFTTGFAGMFVLNVVVFLISLAVEAAYGIAGTAVLWQWLGMACLNCMFFYGFAVFCASLTGHILILPCVYAILNFVVIAVEYFIRLTLSSVCYGMNSSSPLVLGFLSPFYDLVLGNHLSQDIVTAADGSVNVLGYFYNNWTELIIYGAVGIVFTVFAFLLVKHRRMETAGDVVAVKPLKPIFKYCMAFGCALVLGVIISIVILSNGNEYGTEYTVTLTVCMLVGAAIGYFSADMLMKKTLRVFGGKNWIGMAVSGAVIILLMLFCIFDVFGYVQNVPDAENVSSVEIYGSFDSVTLSEPDNIQSVIDLHKSIISNKEIYEKCASGTYGNDSSSGYTGATEILYIDYHLKSGKTMSRGYTIYYGVTDDCDALCDIINSKEAISSRSSLSLPLTSETFSYGEIDYLDAETGESAFYSLSAEEASELYNDCIVPDIENGVLGNVWLNSDYSKVNGKSYYDCAYNCTIYIDLNQRAGSGDYNSDYFQTTVTVGAEKTLAWLSAHDIAPEMQKDDQYYDSASEAA